MYKHNPITGRYKDHLKKISKNKDIVNKKNLQNNIQIVIYRHCGAIFGNGKYSGYNLLFSFDYFLFTACYCKRIK
jgi:hypothetical protein